MPESNQRRYDIDAVRVIAFGLLILYHTAMFYVADWGWHIKSSYQFEWLQQPMMFLNQWRMALLFVISGIATAILLRKTERPFLGPRFKKIGFPLLFGMFVVVVPQAYYEALANQATDPGFLAFWWRYLSNGGWPEGAFAGSDFGVTWNHLWYLPYILFYSLVLCLVLKLLAPIKMRISLPFSSGNLFVWYGALLSVLMVCGFVIFPLFPERTHALIDDWYNHSLYFTFFVLGYCLMQGQAIWESLKRHRRKLLILGIVAYVGLKVLPEVLAQDLSVPQTLLLNFVVYLNRVAWIFVVLAFAYTHLNKPSTFFHYANGAVFSWYILHQTATVVLGAWLSPFMLGGLTEGMLVLAGTILSCLLFHHYIVRHVGFLQPLFGFQVRQKRLPMKPQQENPVNSGSVAAITE